MTHALVIGRRRKGRAIGKGVRETAKQLEAAGWTVETALVDRKREVRKRTAAAVKADADVVVAVGGDGAVGFRQGAPGAVRQTALDEEAGCNRRGVDRAREDDS